jgi:2-hydroxycyclohexanecarboxyl-CoA dehydrogenase
MSPVELPAQRSVIVTGGASPRGIGRPTAARLAAAGWAVAVLDLDGPGAAATAAQVASEHGVESVGLGVDVTDPDAVAQAVAEVQRRLPPVLGLANIAGISSPTPFLDVSAAEWDRVFAANTRSAFLMSQQVLPVMIEHGIGRIVSVSSISAQRGGGTYSKVAYSASKAALIGLSRALAREMSPLGITVNCVAPGPIDTDIMGGPLTDERKQAMSADSMVPRVGRPDEVAALITFLMGPDAGFITAATYDINGGRHNS